MKKNKVISLILICLFSGAIACTNYNLSTPSSDIIIIKYNTCKDLVFNKNGYKICVDSIWDSRCPTGAICIWAGVGEVKFKCSMNNNTEYNFKLATLSNGIYRTDTTINGIHFKLIDLTPYPSTAGINLSDYEIKFSISQ